MKIQELAAKKIAVLGLGVENYALLRYLESQKIKADITVYEKADAKRLGERYLKLKKAKNITWKLSYRSYEIKDAYDILLRSQGVFLSPAYRKRILKQGTIISCPIQIFLDTCPTRNIIGVTGTKGKGTTSSLIQAILKKAGKRAWLAGNIGVAPFDFMSKIRKTDWVVLELSSFHLEDMVSSPMIGVLTNFSPEHLVSADKDNLNHHVSLKAYWDAKLNIFRFQKKGDLAIANLKLADRISREKLPGQVVYFEKSSLPSNLPGEHNKENIAAAEVTARHIGISNPTIAAAVAAFTGLPYRLEKIAVRDGIAYYNDSFATTPASTITALASFPEPVILIAGGADKGSDFTALAKHIKRQAAVVILFTGKGSQKIRAVLLRLKYPKELIREASNMRDAITLARLYAQPGDTILMSPACASFGLFKNYKDRGEQFNSCAGCR